MFLLIFGYVILVLFTLYVTLVSYGVFFGELTFSGKIRAGWFFLVITIFLWWLTYTTFPFQIAVSVL